MTGRHRSVRQAIADVLLAIDGIGKVNLYERYDASQSGLKAFFLDGDRLCGWHIRRISWSQSAKSFSTRRLLESWQVTGYMGLDDAGQSELVFDDLLDTIVTSFNAADNLNGAVFTCEIDSKAGVQLSSSRPVMLADVLCHEAILTLSTVSHISLPEEADLLIDDVRLGLAPEIGSGHEEDYQEVKGSSS